MTKDKYQAIVSAGPCQFCDWTANKGQTPSVAYDPNDPMSAIVFCPKCGFEILGQRALEQEEYEKILKEKEKANV